jgi:hypothetical protein
MTEQIIAYLHRGEWHKAAEVQRKRASDKSAFDGAYPYTLSALRRRREYGRDVPGWVNLDEQTEKA